MRAGHELVGWGMTCGIGRTGIWGEEVERDGPRLAVEMWLREDVGSEVRRISRGVPATPTRT